MSTYYHNPYYSCYPNKKFGYLPLFRKEKKPEVEKEMLLYYSFINKAYKYAYGLSIEEMNKKIMNYYKIGDLACANDFINKVNDAFYLMHYLVNVIYNNALYDTKTCRDKKFLECFKKYWYCKRIDITTIIKDFELEVCQEKGIDYMIVIDKLENPLDIPPNEIE